MSRGPLELLGEVATVLDDLEIPYTLGGSLASSLFGEPRSTIDVDLAIRLTGRSGPVLLARLEATFYVPTDAAQVALDEQSSFNMLDLASGMKVDLFVLGDSVLDVLQIDRRIPVSIPGVGHRIWVTSPEVQVLRKLEWYRQGGSVSDRQWRDVIGILRIAPGLDLALMRDIANALDLETLLAEAIEQAGGAPSP